MARRKPRPKPLGTIWEIPDELVAADRADPQGVLAQEAHRTPGRQLAEDAQRDHLPDAERLPVGPAARAVRPQEHRPRLVPAVGRGRHLREDLGGAGRRVRRTRRGAVAVAESADAMLGKARFGGKKTGKNPTDRGKKGTKKSLLTDGDGGPLGVVIAGANVVEQKLLKETIEAIVVERPDPTRRSRTCAWTRGTTTPRVARRRPKAGYVPHIRRIGEEKKACDRSKGHKPRRWVVERTFAWLSKCRGILVRYEKKDGNYLGLIQLACGLLWYRRLHRMGRCDATQNTT